MDRPGSQPTADDSSILAPWLHKPPSETPPAASETTPATSEQRNAYQRATWDLVVDQTSTVPVEREEGYYQVLGRMHPDWDSDELLTEAHRIKHISNDRDILYVGERLPLATDEERQQLLADSMAAFDKAHSTQSTTDLDDWLKSVGETPDTTAPAPPAQPTDTTPKPAAQPIDATKQPPAQPDESGTPAPNPAESPQTTAAEPPKPTEQQKLVAAAGQLEDAHNAAAKKLAEAESKQGFIGGFVDGAKNLANTLGVPTDSSSGDPRHWLANLIIDGDNGSTAINSKTDSEGKRIADLKQAANSGDTARFNSIYKELTGTDYDPSKQRQLLNAGNADRYDDSQHSGVDSLTSFTAAGASLALARFGIKGTALSPSLVFGGALTGGATKSALTALDGNYSSFWSDAATGSLWGGLAPVAELAGAKMSTNIAAKNGLQLVGDGLATRISTEGASLGTRALSAAAKSGTAMAVFGAVEGPGDDIIRNGGNVTAGDLLSRSATGAITGFAGGTLFGMALDRLAERSNKPTVARTTEPISKPKDTVIPKVEPTPAEPNDVGGGQLLGNKYPDQQDALYVSPDKKLFVVADGIGGKNSGDVASNIVASAMKQQYESFPHNGTDLEVQHWLDNAVKAADRQIDLAKAVHGKMGSTAVAAVHHNGKVFVAWAGDSRLYLIRDGVAGQVTRDHLTYPGDPARRNVISRYVGQGDVDVDHAVIPNTRPGDRIVLMSDGVDLPGTDIARIVGGAPDAKTGVNDLLDYVDSLNRDVQDNTTVVGFDVPGIK